MRQGAGAHAAEITTEVNEMKMSRKTELGSLAGFEPSIVTQMIPLRQLIFDVACNVPAIGALNESLKWGEPSFTPMKKSTGSSVRIAPRKDGRVALHFICHTGLIEEFRELYPNLEIEGKRGIILDMQNPLPLDELRHCIELALTYFQRKRFPERACEREYPERA
jgi:hypothetical protein